MDYSSVIDYANTKPFDDIIATDKKGNFLLEHTPLCFDSCIGEVKGNGFTQKQTDCLKTCFARNYYGFKLVDRSLNH